MKYVKRLFIVVLALPILVFAWVQVQDNSHLVAYDLVHLQCKTTDVGGEFSSPAEETARRRRKLVAFARLQKDEINERVLLQFVADVSQSEDGLQPIQSLSINVDSYSGWDGGSQVQRTIDRNTLVYKLEHKEYSISAVKWWHHRQCEIIDKAVFEKRRNEVVSATKAAQKI